MRRSVVIGLYLVLGWGVLATLSGCGGGNSQTAGPGQPATISLTPSSVSLNRGQFAQLSSLVLDSTGAQILSATVTYVSSNTSVVTVSPGGLLCAGIWDPNSNFTICNPGPTGASNLTSSTGSITSNTVVVTVHEHLDSIVVSPLNPSCVSQSKTQVFTATAQSNDPAVCGANPTPCALNNVGTFSWVATQSGVAKIDPASQPANQPLNQITVTAVNPGQSGVFAEIDQVTSPAATFATCPPASISAHVQNMPGVTSFSIAKSATQQLVADVVDTLGATLTGVPLTWNTSRPTAATVSSGLVTGINPGTASITASCTPPSCNVDVNQPVYSNVVTASITGTAVTTTVFVTTVATPAPGANNSLIPIDTSTNTAGTAIALPKDATVNSLVMSSDGGRGYLGSDQGLMVLNAGARTVATPISGVPGKVLAVSPDGIRVVVSDANNLDPTKRKVYVFNQSTNSVENTLNIANATAAAFSPDSFRAFILAGTDLWVFTPNTTTKNVALGAAAGGVDFLASGSLGYVSAGSNVLARATCDSSSVDSVGATAPTLVAAVPNGTAMLATDSPFLDVITPNFTFTGCPPVATDGITQVNTGSAFVANQLIVTPDSSRAIITGSQASLLVYNISTSGMSSIPLVGGATQSFTGGVTTDSSTLYVGVGGGVNEVQAFKVSDGSLIKEITGISFTPDLVAVKP